MPIQTMTPINAERTRLTAETPSRLLFGLTEGHFGTKMAWLSPHAVRVWPGVREPGQYAAPVNDHYYGAAINRRTVAQMRKGVLYRVFHFYYGKNGITMHSGRHVTVENVNVLGCFGMPIVVDGAQEYGEFRKVVVEPVPGRPCTGTSDGCHVARSKGHVKFIDCVISFQNDDGLNIHDCFTLGVPDGPRRIRVTNVRGPEYLGAQPGNELELLATSARSRATSWSCSRRTSVRSAGRDDSSPRRATASWWTATCRRSRASISSCLTTRSRATIS